LSLEHPDPVVSASLFAGGHLDTLTGKVVAPMVQALAGTVSDDSYLWLMRYGRRGDHLKLRWHGPKTEGAVFRQALEDHAKTGFELLPVGDGPGKPISSETPPIDVEDQAGEALQEDRTLLFTHYRRSHVCLGEQILHRDDTYCCHLTRCLARGTSMVLNRVANESAVPWSHGLRFNLLLTAIIDGLAESDISNTLQTSYLAYHRDWLLRFVAGDRSEEDSREQARRVFDRRLAAMGDARERLFAFVRNRRDSIQSTTQTSVWGSRLAAARTFFEPLCESLAEQLDRHAEKPFFSPLFKIFQGLANQTGLNLAEEAYVHHLLLRAQEQDDPTS